MSFNKKQLKKDSPKKNAIDLKLKPIKKNPNYKYGFSQFQPGEGNLMLGAGFGNSKIGMGAMGMTPLDAENRKYFKGLVDANINYNVNPNLNFRLGVNDVIGGGFNPGLNAGIKLKFEEGGEYVDLELDENDIEYYKNQGYLVEYLDGGNVLPTDPPKKSDDGTIHVTDPNDPDYLKYLEHNKLYRKLKNNLRARQAEDAKTNLKVAKDWLDMVKNEWGETYDELDDVSKEYYDNYQKVIAEKGIDKDYFSYSKFDVDKQRKEGRDVNLSDEDKSYLEQAKALGLDIKFKETTDSRYTNPIVPRPKQKYILDKATTHKDKIKNYKTDLEDYNKEAKAFEEYDKGYNQREDDWKNNYNSYKEKLNKDWGEARNVPDWKIGLNNADGRGVDYLINQGFDIDDITWNDLHWVQQNIIKEGEGFNSSRSFIKPVLNKFTEEYTGVNPTKPTKPKVTLPEGYSYRQDRTRDGDMNDYLKGNKRISREEWIKATGYAPVQFRERKVRAKFAAGGPINNDGPLAKPQGDIYLPLDGTRPSYTDASGKERSEYKIGIGTKEGEMVIPTVWNGEQHTEDEAIDRYYNTGEHMGGPYGSIEEGERAAKLRTFIYNEHPAYRKKAYGGEYEGQLPMVQTGEETEPEYTYLELDDNAIQQYKNGGWVVEEMPEYEEGGNVISPGDGWEYKQEGDTYFTKKEGAADWIDTTGNTKAREAIQTKYFPDAPIERSADASAAEANVGQPINNTSATLPGNISTRAIQEDLAQEIDGEEGYYLGPKGVDGLMGNFTREAMAAKKAGIPPSEYNKKFTSAPLQTLPQVSVPASVIQRANGITPPVSSRLSASAEYSLSQNNERDEDTEQGYRTPVEEYDPAKLWEGDTEHIIGVDLGDEVYQHVDDFIYDTSIKGKDLDALAGSGSKFGADAFQMKLIQSKATSCLKGAKECNKKFVATKVGANSIAGLINQLDRADLTKYSVPSRGGNQNTSASGEFKHTMGYDAWEAGNAMVGEGLAQYLYKVSPDSHKNLDEKGHPKETMQDDLKKIVADGKVPLGSLVFMGDSSDEFGSKYTSSKTGPRDTHAATVVGFNEKGVPMIYDYGDLVPITKNVYHYGINSIVVPKGYENYTYDNLLKGKQKRNKNLGYTNEYLNEKFEANKNLKPYVNQIKKGAHEVKYKIGSDYNIKADVMDKLSDRIVGIAGQESNFGNQGDEDLSWGRQAIIELESDWTNKKLPGMPMGAKTYVKLLKDRGKEEKKGFADWEIEVMASKELGYGDMRKPQFKAKYNELRNKYPKSTGKDKDPFNASVGPFAVKNLPLYAKDELGLDKDLLYGMDVDDKDELERGAKASLIHLVESFVNLRSEYDRETYTDDQIIDLATVAYNNKSKAFNPDFAEYYIKNAQAGRSDDYLSKVKALEYKYAYDNKRKQEIGAAKRAALSAAWYADRPYTNTAATGQSLIEQQRAEDTVPIIESESTSVNRPAFNQYPQVDLTRPRSRGQRDTRSGEEQSTTRSLGSNARSVYTPTSQPTIGRPVSNLHLRNYRKYGGEIKPKDIFIEYLKRKKGI